MNINEYGGPKISRSEYLKSKPKPVKIENFKDGKNPQDKGDSARHNIPKKASIAQLKKIRSSDNASKRKKQLAHWQINMRGGKTNEDAMTAADAGIPQDTANMGPKKKKRSTKLPTHILRRSTVPQVVQDQRIKSNKPPRVIKKFRKYIGDTNG